MTLLDIPDYFISHECDDEITYDFNFTIFTNDGYVRFAVGEISTSWLGLEDRFIERIRFDNLNPCFLEMHLAKEIEMKNVLDCGCDLLENGKYQKAVERFDEVLYYDSEYGEALFFKSKALFGQKHFVKSLRHYKKAIKADPVLEDVEYHKLLLRNSSEERDNFPKIKRDIYAGDEYFAKGDYVRALECYGRALENPTGFKDKILSKLLNKRATSLIRMERIDEAMDVFRQSLKAKPNDYAYYCLGVYAAGPNPEIKRNLKITKKQLLYKAGRLVDFTEYELALDCLDEFLKNHYRVDEDYERALNLKIDALKHLGKDTGDVESILKYSF